MLKILACASTEDLMREVIPPSILSTETLSLASGLSEARALAEIRVLAGKNTIQRSYIGAGYYNTHTPAVIVRNVLENPAWYTSYTPYQAEISQGRLEALMLFQTVIADLTGLEIANASLLDEATACAEAVALCMRANASAGDKCFIDEKNLPQCIEVVRTRADALGVEVVVGPREECLKGDYCAVLFRYPDVDGVLCELRELSEQAHQRGAMVAMATDLLALALLTEPAAMGADVVVGSSQRLGVPMACGGPHAGFIATSKKWARLLPGRLVGASKDAGLRLAYRLALQTREQHIRRERATSNICTAQTLPAVLAAFYAAWHGAAGLREIALRVNQHTRLLAAALADAGFAVENEAFFDTLVVDCGDAAADVIDRAKQAHGINLRQAGEGRVGVSLDETVTRADVHDILSSFSLGKADAGDACDKAAAHLGESIPEALRRQSDFLGHPSFKLYHSETEMMRYLRRLAGRDIGLEKAMIPLGSCTMKLNPSAAMEPISWPEFTQIHPHSPVEQRAGYQELVADLERALCNITGYDAVSLQPNAGSQGEFAGILAVKAYHKACGQDERNICLIPRSAHGTNPASAKMCGMRIVAVDCDRQGNIDIDDLDRKITEHRDRLALMMITYPSTHGVFEERITEICEMVHEAGGQVYMDGANMNAMVGLCYPGAFGCDVSHLNLHKTFCIPHGGGGPGVGPVCVRQHLKRFLPATGDGAVGLVAGAEWGSAGILPISWMYIKMMGVDGLREASECAIINANYIAKRLNGDYRVLYANERGRVAHECIIDIRPFKESAGIEVEDVAKRLIDYSFHPPTMSFPVPGTLMVEPTESESKAELDRFIDAMLSIRKEIAEIESGQADPQDNVLKNAPHCLDDLLADNWARGYSRQKAAFPVTSLQEYKHWPPISRIDQVYGDRNLVCSCLPSLDSD